MGAERKCSSISRAPANSSSKRSMPSVSASDMPIADHSENRPPTHSWNGNTRSGAMPKASQPARLVESAQKCASAPLRPTLASTHAFTSRALAIVSAVVKVFEETRTSVRRGSSCGSTVSHPCPSTLPRLMGRIGSPARHRARLTMVGPRSLPPMPMLSTVSKRWLVAPRSSPRCTLSTKERR